MTTDRQKWTNRIRRACLCETDDVVAATTAAEYLVTAVELGLVDPSAIADDTERMEACLATLDDALAKLQPVHGAALAMLDDGHG